ncbi:MAG: asparaginase [Solirubrobacterales bacterium]|nr:asparaginase [Solirubrobacterales bacterium]
MADRRRIGVLVTGGTIGSRSESIGGLERLVTLSGTDEQLDVFSGPNVESVLEEVGITTVLRQPLNMLSEDMTPEHWVVIGREIEDLIETEAVDGILILHGTDTMSFTSTALSFMLAGIRIPVVLTGSNRPPNEPESDADKNIADALIALQHLTPGVYLSFAGRPNAKSRIHDGVSVRKARGSGPAFVSAGRVHAAEVDWGHFEWVLKTREPESIQEVIPEIASAPFRIAAADKALRVDLHPGINLELIFEMMVRGGYRGVCLTLYPALTAPTSPPEASVPEFAARCAREGIVLALTMNARPVGMRNHYESKFQLEDAGAVLLPVIPEVALVKMMWALGLSEDYAEVRSLLETEVANEFGGRPA